MAWGGLSASDVERTGSNGGALDARGAPLREAKYLSLCNCCKFLGEELIAPSVSNFDLFLCMLRVLEKAYFELF